MLILYSKREMARGKVPERPREHRNILTLRRLATTQQRRREPLFSPGPISLSVPQVKLRRFLDLQLEASLISEGRDFQNKTGSQENGDVCRTVCRSDERMNLQNFRSSFTSNSVISGLSFREPVRGPSGNRESICSGLEGFEELKVLKSPKLNPQVPVSGTETLLLSLKSSSRGQITAFSSWHDICSREQHPEVQLNLG